MTESYQMFPSVVAEVEQLTSLVKRFTFKRIDGESYPEFTAGSHMFVKMNDQFSNAYSLVSGTKDLSSYQICVQKEVNGEGGSAFMHDYCIKGFELEISSPNNLFELSNTDQKHLLIAGGIGITPFITQMQELAQRNANYELKYAFRVPEYAALLTNLNKEVHGDRIQTYISGEGVSLDLDKLISEQPLGTHIYVCGPKLMIDATIESCNRYKHCDEYVHWEQFSSTVSEDGNAFTVILAKSNHRIEVQHDQTILQAIESLNIDVECLCREGVCGTCETAILEGEAEHLDQYLDDNEKLAQKTMMICVSRAKNKEITLDL